LPKALFSFRLDGTSIEMTVVIARSILIASLLKPVA